VAAYAISRDSGYLAVEYYFSNYDQCEVEVKTAK